MSDIYLHMSDDDLKAFVDERMAKIDPEIAAAIKDAPLRSLAAWLNDHAHKYPAPAAPAVDAETEALLKRFGLSTDEFLQARERANASRSATNASMQRLADLLSGPQQEIKEGETDEQ